MRQQLTRKTQEWLCVHDCGYTSHIVVICGYTCLYTVSVPRRCHNLQTMVLRGYTIKTVVIVPSSWLYGLFFSRCVNILPQKNAEMVMCPIPWLYVSYRGYAWLYVVIYCNCTEKESEPRNDSQGRPPFIMTSAASQKYPRRWFYVVIRPSHGYTF